MRLKLICVLIFCLFVNLKLFAAEPTISTKTSRPPLPSTSEIKGFAAEAIMAGFSYNFVNYAKQLTDASRYFTPEAWKGFKKNFLDNSGLIRKMIDNKLVTSGAACGMGPLIIHHGILTETNTYGWWVEFPVIITFLSAESNLQQQKDIQMLILQSNVQEGVRNLIVKKIMLKPTEPKKSVSVHN